MAQPLFKPHAEASSSPRCSSSLNVRRTWQHFDSAVWHQRCLALLVGGGDGPSHHPAQQPSAARRCAAISGRL